LVPMRRDGLHEFGPGRMAEPSEILGCDRSSFVRRPGRWQGHAIVPAGPTHEPIDPVRYLPIGRPAGRGIPLPLPWRPGARVHAGQRPVAIRIPRRNDAPGRECGRDVGRVSGRRCRPMLRCLPPLLPTGGANTSQGKIKKGAARRRLNSVQSGHSPPRLPLPARHGPDWLLGFGGNG